MIRLILARHGETAWNVQHRYQGRTDVELNDAGRRQAAALARRLAQEEIHAIYASDLRRARQTAQAIAGRHGLPVRSAPRLREMSFGAWEGLTYAEIEERDAQTLAAWRADPASVSPPGGETAAQVADRVQAFLDDLARVRQDRTVLLVAHGGTLRMLLCLALGLDFSHFWQLRLDGASLSELCIYESTAVLNYLNDTHHLAATQSTAAARLTLVLGGARSGKSTFAQRLAQEMGGERVLFVATSQPLDEEMRQRIEKHRRERPAGWRTLEAHRDVGRAILARHDGADVVLVDCLTVLVSNLLMDSEKDPFAAEAAARVDAEIEALVACAGRLPGRLIVVSNEVGMGLVPPYPLGRAYRDLLGRANQALAQAADEVYLLVAGIPRLLKGTGM